VLAATLVQAGSVVRPRPRRERRRAARHRRHARSGPAHVLRLPTSYFDNTKSGVLISRIMTDPEGIRNLVGTGIIQLVGGVFTAALALAFLLYSTGS
jgi:ABC-type multidrug transport system fused ATPase/permease subunit